MKSSRPIRLSSHARQVFAELAHSGAPGREVRRAQALLWLDAGESVQVVARRLHVSRQMIYALIARYQARRERSVTARLADAQHTGRPATKRHLAMEQVAQFLVTAPRDYGYRGQVWTTTMLQTQIQKKCAVWLSDDTLQRALHALNYRYKRPRYVLARRAPFWRQAKGGLKTG
jgi:transposase